MGLKKAGNPDSFLANNDVNIRVTVQYERERGMRDSSIPGSHPGEDVGSSLLVDGCDSSHLETM